MATQTTKARRSRGHSMGCGYRQLQRARHSRRRVNWAKPDRHGQAGRQVSRGRASDDLPLAALPSIANVNNTMLFPAL